MQVENKIHGLLIGLPSVVGDPDSYRDRTTAWLAYRYIMEKTNKGEKSEQ